MSEIKFATGIYFNQPHEKAPEFVLGSMSIMPDMFAEWLAQQTPNEKGYVKLKVNMSKAGKPYVALDDWKPESGTQRGPIPDAQPQGPGYVDDYDDGIPFAPRMDW